VPGAVDGRGLRVGVLTDGSACIQRRKVAGWRLSAGGCIVYSDDLLGSRQSLQLREDAFQIMALQLEVDFARRCMSRQPAGGFCHPAPAGPAHRRIPAQSRGARGGEPPTPEFART
jgi:hypothetical protein